MKDKREIERDRIMYDKVSNDKKSEIILEGVIDRKNSKQR